MTKENSVADIKHFYDEFSRRLLNDYVYGNIRVEAAVNRVVKNIKKSHKKILDIGCGIGHSSVLYQEAAPWVEVVGVDISPKNIEIANKMFSNEHVTFLESEMDKPLNQGPFDVVVLLDVYEHVPRTSWTKFNKVLADSVSPKGLLVLTTPSPFHQKFLELNNPSGLQIIDETMFFEDVVQLKSDFSGTLTCYEMSSIWKTNDYLHVVIDRNPEYLLIESQESRVSSEGLLSRLKRQFFNSFHNDEIALRKKLVRESLGVEPE